MPPIPVHSSSPINPASGLVADGVTPSTAAEENSPSVPGGGQRPAAVAAKTTGLAPVNSIPAQPGASAGPTPTSLTTAKSSRYAPTATVPASSTQTTSSPPPPQPGTVPSPLEASPAQLDVRRSSIPPPPKAGEIPKPAEYYAPQYASSPTTTPTYTSPASPPQLPFHQQQPSVSIPTRAQPPASMTCTIHDLSHPPGYVQDSRASFEERPLEPYQPFVNCSNHKLTPSVSAGGLLDGSPENRPGMVEEKGIWGEAVSWAKKIGGKVVEGEEAIWKRINGGN